MQGKGIYGKALCSLFNFSVNLNCSKKQSLCLFKSKKINKYSISKEKYVYVVEEFEKGTTRLFSRSFVFNMRRKENGSQGKKWSQKELFFSSLFFFF